MGFDDFLQRAWADHAERTDEVMARLPEGLPLVTEARHLPALAALVVHVAGEHLGRWGEGLARLAELAGHRLFDPASAEGKAVHRSMAVLHLGLGDEPSFEAHLRKGRSGGQVPPASDRVRVLALAAGALAAQRRTSDALRRLREALVEAAYGPKKGDPAAQALAVTGNNVACTLEEFPSRTPAEVELMKLAAETGRRYWEIAGDWTNVERAEYRLAMTHLKAGEPRLALQHAHQCLAVCEANDAPAGERFFAHEACSRAFHALGDAAASLAARDQAAELLPRVGDDLREVCQEELGKLDVALSLRR